MQSHDTPHPTDSAASDSLCINLNRLQVGDVLLFRGQKRTARIIAAGSADATEDVRYNHAAFVVDRFSWLEATRTGIGYRHPLLAKIEEDSGTHRYLHRCEHGVTIVALRHPSFNPANAGLYAKQLVQELSDVVGLPYPSLLALAKAANALQQRQWLGNFIRSIGYLTTRLTADGKRGLFCSQLVATIYADFLNLPLFWDAGKPPEEISPASLGNPTVCRLRPIDDFLVPERSDLPDTSVESAQKFRDPRLGQRAESLKQGLVRARRTGMVDDETIDLTEETALAIQQFALEATADNSRE